MTKFENLTEKDDCITFSEQLVAVKVCAGKASKCPAHSELVGVARVPLEDPAPQLAGPDSLPRMWNTTKIPVQSDWPLENRVTVGVSSHFIDWKDEKAGVQRRSSKEHSEKTPWASGTKTQQHLRLTPSNTHNPSFWLKILQPRVLTDVPITCFQAEKKKEKQSHDYFSKIHGQHERRDQKQRKWSLESRQQKMMAQRQWKQKKGAGTLTATNCSLIVMQSSLSNSQRREGRENTNILVPSLSSIISSGWPGSLIRIGFLFSHKRLIYSYALFSHLFRINS